MVCRVSVVGSWSAGMRTRARGLPLNLVLVLGLGEGWLVEHSFSGLGRHAGKSCVSGIAVKLLLLYCCSYTVVVVSVKITICFAQLRLQKSRGMICS